LTPEFFVFWYFGENHTKNYITLEKDKMNSVFGGYTFYQEGTLQISCEACNYNYTKDFYFYGKGSTKEIALEAVQKDLARLRDYCELCPRCQYIQSWMKRGWAKSASESIGEVIEIVLLGALGLSWVSMSMLIGNFSSFTWGVFAFLIGGVIVSFFDIAGIVLNVTDAITEAIVKKKMAQDPNEKWYKSRNNSRPTKNIFPTIAFEKPGEEFMRFWEEVEEEFISWEKVND
jgi:hypothetical protein